MKHLLITLSILVLVFPVSLAAQQIQQFSGLALKVSPIGGEYKGRVIVAIDVIGDYRQVYYTRDGSEPTKESVRYTGPFALEQPGTVIITARVLTDDGWGPQTSVTYTVKEQP
jgi:hypothetical protein